MEIAERIARTETEIQELRNWQGKQNGSLQTMEQKLDRIYMWLIGLMGGVVASLILLVVNMGIKK